MHDGSVGSTATSTRGGRLIFGYWDKIFEFWTNIRVLDTIPGFGTKYLGSWTNPWVLDKIKINLFKVRGGGVQIEIENPTSLGSVKVPRNQNVYSLNLKKKKKNPNPKDLSKPRRFVQYPNISLPPLQQHHTYPLPNKHIMDNSSAAKQYSNTCSKDLIIILRFWFRFIFRKKLNNQLCFNKYSYR